MSINLEDLLACAVSAARSAGNYALQNKNRRTEVVSMSSHDVKLRLDIECQERAESVIHAAFPEHSIIGEETSTGATRADAGSEFEWIIDPIDGTLNFSHGLPCWCCSVAVRHHDDIVVGAVFAPEPDELYTAAVDRPALRDGSPIHVSDTDRLSRSIVFTGLDTSVRPNLPPFALFEKIACNAQRARIMGSAALDTCRVACGHAEGYFESGIYIWDIAAAGLIVQRAGGKAEIVEYQENNRLLFLATNGRVHAQLRKLVDIGPTDKG